MLRINAIPNTSAAKNYYKSADYHLEGKESPAFWHGKGAERLGLLGEVQEADFIALCENKDPHSGKQLTAKHLDNRRVGYDFTWSVSKSVSLAYALGGDERIPDSFRSAVAETMAEMEREMETRVRKGGENCNRTVGNMVWVDFLHHTSRPIKGQPDPQLHVHAVVFNTVYDPVEQKWKAGEFAALKANAPYFQAAFRARLANKMQDLGYEVKRTRDDFEIVGVPPRAIKEFSRRTDQIEKLAEQLGVTRPETKAKLGATSRDKKIQGLTWDELRNLWFDRVTPGEKEAINATVAKATTPVERPSREREALGWAMDHVFERNSVVTQRELMTHTLRNGVGNVTVEGVLKEIGNHKGLIRRDDGQQTLVTSKAVYAEEQSIIDFAKKGKHRYRPLAKGIEIGDALSPSQQAAVRHVWTTLDRLIMIRGAAGTGKTTLTKTALAGINAPYVILAPTSEASRGVLRKDGFQDADTLAKFLADDKMQDKVKGGVIWLDEASLAGARDMAKLVKVADSLNARIVLSGDRRQHRSVQRGDILALLEDKAKLPVATVSEIKRQAGEYRDAVKLASEGRAGEAFSKLDKLGWIKEVPGSSNGRTPDFESGNAGSIPAPGAMYKVIADDYLDAIKSGKSVLVISPTHADGDKLTAELRERLKTGGQLVYDKKGNAKEVGVIHGEEKRFDRLENVQLTEAQKADPETLKAYVGSSAVYIRHSPTTRAGQRVEITEENAERLAREANRFVVYRKAELDLAAGDTIRITANAKDLSGEHRINNGSMYQVAGFDNDGNVRLNNGWMLGKNFGTWQHGLVVTSHAAQGKTVDITLLHMPTTTFGAVDNAAGYVSMSRARQKTVVFTDEKAELLHAVDRDRPRMLAHELIRKPRHRVRERLRKALAFLRGVMNSPQHQREQTIQNERGYGYGY